MTDLKTITQSLLADKKGILAADESNPSANKRFAPLNIEQTEEKRRQYRQLLFMTPNIEEYLSGVILYDETIRQTADEGTLFTDILTERGIIPGIKVDMGLRPLPGFEGEKVTQGLDNLDERLQEYKKMGAKFTKWRGVITIGEKIPTRECIAANAHVLARYAGIVQEAGMVPIVEPEVLLEGEHTIERAREVVDKTLQAVFEQMDTYKVDLEGLVLKTSMVLPGSDSGQEVTHQRVADETADALRANVPSDTAGVVFLSGGQTAEDAIIHLNEIAKRGPYDWPVTFSYSRALQEPVLSHWAGNPENMVTAQDIFLEQVKKAAAAQAGAYEPE